MVEHVFLREYRVFPFFFFVAGWVINDFPALVYVKFAQSSVGGVVYGSFCLVVNAIIKDLDLEPRCYAVVRDFVE